jgi:hypothetical protein
MPSRHRFIYLSLLLHGLLMLALWNIETPPPKKESPVKFEIVEVEKGKQLGPKNSLNIPRQKKLSGKKSGLEGFLPNYKFDSTLAGPNGDSYSINPRVDNPNADWGSGAGTLERIQDFNLYKVLYTQIDSTLFYPGVLARNKITGTVNARIVLEKSGDCSWQKTKIQGHDAYLELYVLDVLKTVCKMNFKRYLAGREITNADLSFKFDINENNDWERLEKEKVIVGNALLFYRNSHQSIAEWELGPFHGIFPVPMIYLNIPWIQENWESLVSKKDPLKEFRKKFGNT